MLVELLVFLCADVVFRPCPQRRSLIDGFIFIRCYLLAIFPFRLFHHNRQRDVIRVFTDGRFQFPIIQKLVFALTQVQGNFRATTSLFDGLQRVIALACRFPTHCLSAASLARSQCDFISHDKCRIKAHAKLANQIGVFGLVAGECREKFAGAGLGNGADM